MTTKIQCAVCAKKTTDPICSKCTANPFRIEDYRNILAVKKDFIELSKWYKKNLPQIPNLNTAKFWDKKLKENESLSSQDGMTRNRIRTVENFLDIKAKNILDIGAGHGYLEEYLNQKRKLNFFANDFSKESVSHLKKRFKGDFQVQSIYKLNYPNKKFDAIFTLEVLEHIPPSKVFFVLKSIKKLLKPNSQYIVSVPTNEGLEKMKLNLNGHVRLYTIPLITTELEMAGFKVENLRTLYAFDTLYEIKNTIARFYKKWQPNNIILSARST